MIRWSGREWIPDSDLKIPRVFRPCGLGEGPNEGPFVKELSATYLAGELVHRPGKPAIFWGVFL
jgi:hypothetical protein